MSAAADCGGVEVGLTCFIDFGSACFGGFAGGLIHCGTLSLIQKRHIDDPIGAFAVHDFVLPPRPRLWDPLQQHLLDEVPILCRGGIGWPHRFRVAPHLPRSVGPPPEIPHGRRPHRSLRGGGMSLGPDPMLGLEASRMESCMGPADLMWGVRALAGRIRGNNLEGAPRAAAPCPQRWGPLPRHPRWPREHHVWL